MTARTFGRRGLATAEAQAPAISARRGALLGTEPVPVADDAEARRAAFVAAERARAAPAAAEGPVASEEAVRAVLAGGPAEAAYPPTDRSLNLAYALWFALGLAGAHRLYLRHFPTGALMAAILFGSWGAMAIFEYYQAFAGMVVACLWMIADGFRIRRMHERSGPR